MSAALQTKGTKACNEAGKSDPQLREKKKKKEEKQGGKGGGGGREEK